MVILAAELLKRAQELVLQGIHPTSIISGYKLALKESVKYITESLATRVDTLGKDVMVNVAKDVHEQQDSEHGR